MFGQPAGPAFSNRQKRRIASRRFVGWSARARKPRGAQPGPSVCNPRHRHVGRAVGHRASRQPPGQHRTMAAPPGFISSAGTPGPAKTKSGPERDRNVRTTVEVTMINNEATCGDRSRARSFRRSTAIRRAQGPARRKHDLVRTPGIRVVHALCMDCASAPRRRRNRFSQRDRRFGPPRQPRLTPHPRIARSSIRHSRGVGVGRDTVPRLKTCGPPAKASTVARGRVAQRRRRRPPAAAGRDCPARTSAAGSVARRPGRIDRRVERHAPAPRPPPRSAA